MNDYLSRRDLPPVELTVPRAAPVQSVQPVSTVASAGGRERGIGQESAAFAGQADGDIATAAEYAEVHARISGILADLKSAVVSMDVTDAQLAIDATMPKPIVLIPLPPASREAMEYAADVAKRMVQMASYTHAAHNPVQRGAVQQLLSI